VLSSLATIYSATGMDLVPAGAELQDLPALTAQVDQAIARWQAGQLPELPAAAAPAAATPVAAAASPTDTRSAKVQ
jgi:hypothetical protein